MGVPACCISFGALLLHCRIGCVLGLELWGKCVLVDPATWLTGGAPPRQECGAIAWSLGAHRQGADGLTGSELLGAALPGGGTTQ